MFPPIDIPLSVDDLPWIMTLLGRIASKWKKIALALGIQNDRVMAIMEQSSDVTVQLNMGITKWLQQASSAVTLAALAKALSSSEVGEEELATEIVKGKIL